MINKICNALKRETFFGFYKLIFNRILTSIIALPISVGIVAISPFIKLRLIKLFSSRIGHYALNTELLLCAQDIDLFNEENKYRVLFYTSPGDPICNKQLHRMWKRTITILPFPSLCNQVDKYLMLFLGDEYRKYALKETFEGAPGARDQWNLLERIDKCHISFTPAEERKGRELIQKLGIPSNAPFVCLLGRDFQYLKAYIPSTDWSYHDYRDVQISNYQKAAEFLAENGYYVIRMGKNVSEKFEMNHSKIIDYANHSLRSDFLDIYLSAHCFFFISPRSGIDAVAQIFRRPLVLTNFPLCDHIALYFLKLLIPKKVQDLKSGRFLTFEEMCWKIDRKSMMHILEEKGWRFIENTPDEILEIVKEMLSRLTSVWNENDDSQLLQEKFWKKIPGNLQNMRIGDSFIRNHQSLLN